MHVQTESTDRFTALPDEETLAGTVAALEAHGFSAEVVDDLDAAREAVLARIPHGSSVMTNPSVTLQETGIAEAINDGGGPYESAGMKLATLDRATQLREIKTIFTQPDFSLGSVHAVTRDGRSSSPLRWEASWRRMRGAPPTSSSSSARRSSSPTSTRPTSASTGTASRSRTRERARSTDRAAASASSSRSTRTTRAASTSSSSAYRSGSDRGLRTTWRGDLQPATDARIRPDTRSSPAPLRTSRTTRRSCTSEWVGHRATRPTKSRTRAVRARSATRASRGRLFFPTVVRRRVTPHAF